MRMRRRLASNALPPTTSIATTRSAPAPAAIAAIDELPLLPSLAGGGGAVGGGAGGGCGGAEGGGGATTMVAAAPVTTCTGDVDSTVTPRLDDRAADDWEVSELAAAATAEAVEVVEAVEAVALLVPPPPFCGAVSGMVMVALTLTLPAVTRSSR